MESLRNTHRRKSKIAVLLTFVCFISRAQALTLPELLQAASENHPTIQAARQGVNAANEDVTVARRQYWPTPSALVESGAPNRLQTPTQLLRIEQTLWDFGLTAANVKVAERGADIASAAFETQRQTIGLQVIDAWSTLLSSYGRMRVGYFSTTGLASMDFVLADPLSVPAEEEMFFTEKVIRLPDTRYCFSPLQAALSERGLPSARQDCVTFGCYQALPKINDRVLRAWAQVLSAAPTARLRIRSSQLDSPAVAGAFRSRLQAAGLPLERVETLPPLPYDAYLQSHSDIDVLLDTFPYPGGTTTAEALYLGVPTLSLALPGMLGRQGESILKNGGLGHWVCSDETDYVAKASAIGRGESSWLNEAANLRAMAPAHVTNSPLYDAHRFARDWVDALRLAWRQAVAPGDR